MSEAAAEATRRPARSLAEWPAYVLLIILAGALAFQVEIEKATSIEHARRDQHERAIQDSRQVAARLERYFDQIYRGLRTVARLPGIRNIDRHADNFHNYARASAQEIYNNLSETVKVSEMYVMPVDFEPDAIDPVTGKPQEPITTFDELIVGRSADRKIPERSAIPATGANIEEIEIHEYRLMQHQIAALKARYADETTISNLAYPAILGREVVTCDNSHYSAVNPNDEDRKGVVYSIPFYGFDGRMRGIVSAVILTSSIRQQLPAGRYSIANRNYDFEVSSPAAAPAPSTAVSQSFDLSVRDETGGWTLINAVSPTAHLASADVLAAVDKANHRHIALLITALALMSIVRLSAQRHKEVHSRNALLEQKVRERTVALESARKDAEAANLAKTRFLAHMSHEIRTPLSAVLGTVDLLMHAKSSAPLDRHLTTIRNSGQSLLDLINEMLDLSAVEAGRVTLSPAPSPVRAMMADVSRLLEPKAAAKGLTLELSIAPAVPRIIWIDGGRFRQVLINLVANAINATQIGTVRVTADLDSLAPANTPRLRFEVIDTGPGVPAYLGQTIFKLKSPVVSQTASRDSGAGLGLSISRALVEKMGGEIGHCNRPEGGAVFYFTLPLREADSDEPGNIVAPPAFHHATAAAGNASPIAGLHVLLVEDNATLAALTREILQNAGCDITVRADGLAALATIESETFDLVLMDCRLQGMDGLEITRLIRACESQLRQPDPIPIVALTANAFDWDRHACMAAGMNDFLSKPYSAAQLVDIVQRNVGRASCVTGARKVPAEAI